VADSRPEREKDLKKLTQVAKFTKTADEIINDPDIDAVVIATPVFTHYELALKALQNNKHVLVEKPMASNSKQAIELIELF
jgi:predicted dehydrogenase